MIVSDGHDSSQMWWLLKEPFWRCKGYLHRILPGYLVKYGIQLVLACSLPPHKFIEISRQQIPTNTFHRLQLCLDAIPIWPDRLGADASHRVHKEQWVVHRSMLQPRKIAHLVVCPPLIGIHHRAGPNVLVDDGQKGGRVPSFHDLHEASGRWCRAIYHAKDPGLSNRGAATVMHACTCCRIVTRLFELFCLGLPRALVGVAALCYKLLEESYIIMSTPVTRLTPTWVQAEVTGVDMLHK